MKTKIYIATHKKIETQKEEGYTPIQVGAEINEELPYLKDNTGDNISKKNKNYCELTALYWIWKNTSEDIVGLTHYRRFFFKNILSKQLLKIKDIEKILTRNDIILPNKVHLDITIEEHYKYYEEKGLNKKEIIKQIAKDRKVNKNEIYQKFTKA